MPRHDEPRVNRRKFLAFAGTAAVTTTLAGCVGDDDDPGEPTPTPDDDDDDVTPTPPDDDPEPGEIRITQRQWPTTLDPHDHRETTTDNVILQSYEQLIAREADGTMVESLAVEWEEVDEDHHRMTIREGVQFHEGGEFTANDAAFSIMRVRDEDVGNLASPQADQIPGIDDAEASDEYTLEIHSGDPNPMVFANLGSYTPMMQEDWVMDHEPEYVAENMNGTGAYVQEEYVDGEYIQFSAFEDYWRGAPDIDSLVMDASTESATRVSSLLAGESDLVDAVPPADAADVDAAEDTRILDAPSTRILMLPMVYNQEPFTSQEFRQAMNYAIDFEAIIDEVLRGFGDATAQPTLEGYFGHNPDLEPYPYDPPEAERLVDESGFAGAELELHMPTGRYLMSDEIAEACAGYVDDLSNVSCELVPRDFGELAGQLLDGDPNTSPPFFLIGWGNSTFDAQPNLLPWFTEGTSIYTFVDEELEELIFAAQSETDEDERESLLQEACALAHDLAVFVFLNREYLIYGVNERIEWEPRQDEHQLVREMSLRD